LTGVTHTPGASFERTSSLAARLPAVPSRLQLGLSARAALPSGANFERMRVMVNTFCSGQSLTTHDRKRRHEELVLESDARPMSQITQQSSDSLSTPFGQHGPHSKRQRLHVSSCNVVVVRGFLFACSVTAENGWTLVEGHTLLIHIFMQCQEAQLTQMQSSSTFPDRHSFSGQGCYVVSSCHAEYKLADSVVTVAVLNAIIYPWLACKQLLNLQALCTLVCHNLNYTGQRLMVIAPATASVKILS